VDLSGNSLLEDALYNSAINQPNSKIKPQ